MTGNLANEALKKRRGTYETDKVPIMGCVQRNGEVRFKVTRNVQTVVVKPLIEQWVAPDSIIYTDDYNIYNFLEKAEHYTHKVVCHSAGQYAIDLDGDGINETHCNTQEGLWSLLRPWIRPHRGINKRYLAFYVVPCQFFYNLKRLSTIQQIRRVISLASPPWEGLLKNCAEYRSFGKLLNLDSTILSKSVKNKIITRTTFLYRKEKSL